MVLSLLTAMKFYEPCLNQVYEEVKISQVVLQEKLMQFFVKVLFCEGSPIVYKVCQAMCRYETIAEERTLVNTIQIFNNKRLKP